MPAPDRRQALKDLQSIPGIGPSLARDLVDLGYRRVGQLRRADPDRMYEKLMALRGERIDRCVLYVFRCAVYYADRATHDPELLKWWNWKDGGKGCRPAAPDALRHIARVRDAVDDRDGEK